MSEYVWLLDSEFCCKCGAILDYFESTLCDFCYEEQGRQEQRDLEEGFEDYEETGGDAMSDDMLYPYGLPADLLGTLKHSNRQGEQPPFRDLEVSA